MTACNFRLVFAERNETQKYEGIRSPKKSITEFLLLAKDCLREMPCILSTTIEAIEKLAISTPDSMPQLHRPERDIEYLLTISEKLYKEASSINDIVCVNRGFLMSYFSKLL